MMAEL